MNPLAVIQALNSYTIYKGCYQYALALQAFLPGSIIWSNTDHCVVEIDGNFYDHEGISALGPDAPGNFIPLVCSEVIERAKSWHVDNPPEKEERREG